MLNLKKEQICKLKSTFLTIEALVKKTDVEVTGLSIRDIYHVRHASEGWSSKQPTINFSEFYVWVPRNIFLQMQDRSYASITKITVRQDTIRQVRDFGSSKHSRVVSTASDAVVDSYKMGVIYAGKLLDEVRFRCKQGSRT